MWRQLSSIDRRHARTHTPPLKPSRPFSYDKNKQLHICRDSHERRPLPCPPPIALNESYSPTLWGRAEATYLFYGHHVALPSDAARNFPSVLSIRASPLARKPTDEGMRVPFTVNDAVCVCVCLTSAPIYYSPKRMFLPSPPPPSSLRRIGGWG